MLVFITPTRFKKLKSCLINLFFLTSIIFSAASTSTAQSVTLYTPYTKISVPPGQSITYNIDIINKGKTVCNAPISVWGLRRGWTHTIKSGGMDVEQLSVLPGGRQTFTLQVQVPLRVNKGTYHFTVSAAGAGQIPLTVVVSQQGTLETGLTTQQANMQGASNSTFTYSAVLRNGTDADQVYALNAEAPPGWNVTFKANYKQVSSVSVPANKTQTISVSIVPADQTPAGTYKIPVIAGTGSTSANLTLEVVVTGSYSMQVTTPSGLLSTSATAGDEQQIDVLVNNTGSTELDNVTLLPTAPANWTVTFNPKKIDNITAGGSSRVVATIKPDKNAIAGDYLVTLEAKTPQVSSKADIRVSVKTSLLSGWLGLLIILLALGSVYYLFRKYGRR